MNSLSFTTSSSVRWFFASSRSWLGYLYRYRLERDGCLLIRHDPFRRYCDGDSLYYDVIIMTKLYSALSALTASLVGCEIDRFERNRSRRCEGWPFWAMSIECTWHKSHWSRFNYVYGNRQTLKLKAQKTIVLIIPNCVLNSLFH